MAMNLRNPIQLLRGLPSQIRDSNAAEGTLYYDRAHGALVTKSASGFKYSPVLADTMGTGMLIYVDANAGNDDNDGLSKESAVRTLDKAFWIASLVLNSYFPTIQLAAGTYSTNSRTWPDCFVFGEDKDTTIINCKALQILSHHIELGHVTLNISDSVAGCNLVGYQSNVVIKNSKIISNEDAAFFIYVGDSGYMFMENVELDISNRTFSTGILCAALSSAIQLTGNITFIGPATAQSGTIVVYTNSIVDIRDDYAVISNQGTITGYRYWANVGSIISSHNKGAYVFPGTIDGILQAGAAYY